jgi:hypothetical protein
LTASQKVRSTTDVIPAKAGIQSFQHILDPVFTGVTELTSFAIGSYIYFFLLCEEKNFSDPPWVVWQHGRKATRECVTISATRACLARNRFNRYLLESTFWENAFVSQIITRTAQE